MEFSIPRGIEHSAFAGRINAVQNASATARLPPTHGATPFSIEDILNRCAPCLPTQTPPCRNRRTPSDSTPEVGARSSPNMVNGDDSVNQNIVKIAKSETCFSFTALPSVPKCLGFATCTAAVCVCRERYVDGENDPWPFLMRTPGKSEEETFSLFLFYTLDALKMIAFIALHTFGKKKTKKRSITTLLYEGIC